MTNIVKKIEGTINTPVGKIKQNADGHSFDKEGLDQETLGKSQLSVISAKDQNKKGG